MEIANGAQISYTSDTNSQMYMITLQDGSIFNLQQGASVVMNGDAETQNAARDWRAIYSTGSLTCSRLDGDITINNARGRALYSSGNLNIDDMAADIFMNNPNGDNRYAYGIVSYSGDITMNKLTGTVKTVFGKGNNGYAIAAQQGSVIINGDISGTIETQLGTSHAGMALYAANNVTVAGDISGNIYARGGSGSGYAICAQKGDVSIKSISGNVSGDCYNEIMENSQSGASAIYAGGSIYGSFDGSTYTPIELSGTLSSKAGRSEAYTINSGDKVYINIAEGGSVLAQSSYGADFNCPEASYEPMSNNWGGVATAAIGNEIHITGSNDAVTVKSESAEGTAVNSSALIESTTRENANAVNNLLYYVARNDIAKAKTAAESMTDEQKALISNYDEIENALSHLVNVSTADELIAAIANAKDGDVITLLEDITLIEATSNQYASAIARAITIDKDITLTGKTIHRGEPHLGHLFNVTGKLTLKDITLNGGSSNGIETNAALVCVSAGGELQTESGTVLQNNNNTYTHGVNFGGAVYVAADATFNMNGGIIQNNSAKTGGGVDNCGTFNLNGGSVINNTSTANNSGGVRNQGDFTAENATISNNTGTGVWSYKSITMTDCTVENNTASLGGGIYVQDVNKAANNEITVVLTLNNCKVNNNTATGKYGGGIWCNGKFVMNGGEISGNSSTNQGGGVYGSGDFEINGTITNNESNAGGGVYNYTSGTNPGGTCVIKSNAVILGNTARSSSGGGICSWNSTTLIIEEGASVTNNHAAKNGGGVWSDSETVIADGAVTNNTADGSGTNIYKEWAWATATDAGYYYADTTKYGMMRFLFAAHPVDEILEAGIKYSDADNITAEITSDNKILSKEGNINAFYGDIAEIPENNDKTVYASAYVKTADGTVYWSDPIWCTANWENNYSGYNGGAE